MKKLKTTVRKSEELQGPTKTKKITVKDLKKETKKKKKNQFKKFLYERVKNGVEIYYKCYEYMNENDLKTVSEDYLNLKTIKEEIIKITSQLKRQNTQERKHLSMILMVM